MAAVATDLARRGWAVSGSDSQFHPPMSDLLGFSRVSICRGFAAENLPTDGLIVVGNALSRGNVEVEAALDRNLPLISLPELIRLYYLPGRLSVVVAGTHGKTTTTSMAAHLLRRLGRDPGWMIGGEPADLPAPCACGGGEMFVIEGDEYDTAWFDKRPKFLLYRPYYAILTSVEFDHSDIYRDIRAVEDAFRRFAGLLPEKGMLLVCGDDPRAVSVAGDARCRVATYGQGDFCDWRVEDATAPGQPGAQGSVSGPRGISLGLTLRVAGRHSLLNALAALALAVELGIDPQAAAEALSGFSGVARRLQKIAEAGGIILYDDFAHHPTAIRATLEAVRRMHPAARLWALFEPRSNTMVRNYFQNELKEALKIADRVVIGPLHRREKIPRNLRLDTSGIAARLSDSGTPTLALNTMDGAADRVAADLAAGDVLLVMSNGAFGGITAQLKAAIEERAERIN